MLGIVVFVLVGAIAGWLAGQIMKGSGFGLYGNIIVGIIGAFVADLVLPNFGLAKGLIGSVITATIGAAVFLFVVNMLRRN